MPKDKMYKQDMPKGKTMNSKTPLTQKGMGFDVKNPDGLAGKLGVPKNSRPNSR